MKVTFNNNEYVRSHAKKPRGGVRGSWAFQIVEINQYQGEGEIHFSPSMTLAEAKKWVMSLVREEAIQLVPAADAVDVAILP